MSPGVDPAGPDAVLVVLPTYNEILTLEATVTGIRNSGYAVLIVDDASPDGTGALGDRLASGDPGVTVLHRPAKLGLGSAYLQGFQLGLDRGAGFLVEMDADGSHLPVHLPAIVEASRSSGGLAIGSRYVSGGSVEGWGPARWLLSWAANHYCRLVLRLQVRDSTSGFRCYPRALLEEIGLDRVLSQGYSFQVEMVYRCARLGYPVVEVPIRFEDRILGRSKVSEGEVRKALVNVLRLRFRRWP